MQYYTVLYNTMQYYTVLYNTMQYYTVLYNTMQYYTEKTYYQILPIQTATVSYNRLK